VARSAQHEVSVALHPRCSALFLLCIYQALCGFTKLADLAIMGLKEEIISWSGCTLLSQLLQIGFDF